MVPNSAMADLPALLGGAPAVTAAPPPWPLVDEEALAEITRVITEETLCPVGAEGTQGEFERSFAAMHGRKYGLAVNGDHWHTPPHFTGGGSFALDAARAQGLAGIVAKRLDSPYLPGRRSRLWLSIDV